MLLKGELEGRLDGLFYQPERLDFYKKLKENQTFKKLKNTIKESSYGILPPGDSYNESHPITFIRATEMKEDFEIDYESAYKVEEQYYKSKRCRLQKNDILIAVKGATIASPKSVVFVEKNVENTIINGSIFRIQSNEQVIPKYLAYMLSSETSKKQMKYSLVANNAVDYLDKQLIENLLIYLPPLETQQTIIHIFENAYAEKKAKEAQAKALLASIDGYLLDELGIVLPEKQANMLKNRVFLRNISEVSGGRFDALFHSGSIYGEIQNTTFDFVNLGKVVAYFKNGFAAGHKDQDLTESGIIQIRPTNINEQRELIFQKNIWVNKMNKEQHLKDVLQTGEVLFNNTNSQELVGKTVFFDLTGEYYSSNHITRIKTTNGVLNPQYLTNIFNLYQREKVFFNSCVNWNNQSGVNTETLSSIKIPLPPLEIQEKIVAEITTRREQAKRLQTEAKAVLENAKIEVERMILGGGEDD